MDDLGALEYARDDDRHEDPDSDEGNLRHRQDDGDGSILLLDLLPSSSAPTLLRQVRLAALVGGKSVN